MSSSVSDEREDESIEVIDETMKVRQTVDQSIVVMTRRSIDRSLAERTQCNVRHCLSSSRKHYNSEHGQCQ